MNSVLTVAYQVLEWALILSGWGLFFYFRYSNDSKLSWFKAVYKSILPFTVFGIAVAILIADFTYMYPGGFVYPLIWLLGPIPYNFFILYKKTRCKVPSV